MAESAAIQPIDASAPQSMNPSNNQSELNSTNVFAFGLQSSYPAFNHQEQANNQQNHQMNGTNTENNHSNQQTGGSPPSEGSFDYNTFYQQFMYPMGQFPNQPVNPAAINPGMGSPYLSPTAPLDFAQLNLGGPLMFGMPGLPVYNQSINSPLNQQSINPPTNSTLNSRPNAAVCKYFTQGHCNRGDQCNFAHTNGRFGYPANQSNNQSVNQQMNGSQRGGRGGRGGRRPNGRDDNNQSNGYHRSPPGNQQYPGNQLFNTSSGLNYPEPILPLNQSINQSLNQALMPMSPAMLSIDAALLAMSPYSQASSVDHSVNYPFPSISLGPTSQSINQPINQSINPLSPSIGSINQSNQALINSLSNSAMSSSMHPSAQQSMNPLINPSVNHSINQSVSQIASLDDIRGKVLSLSKDQYGCRFLQRLIDENRPGLIDLIYSEVFDSLIDLMMDPFSNYLCQKLIECVTPSQRLRMVQSIKPSIVPIALNLHGTRSIQKLIESQCTPEEIDCLIACLRPHVVALITDLNGNHVIQRCLQHFPSSASQFVYDTVCAECLIVCTHKHGCCVMQRCLDYATPAQKQQCIERIAQHCLTLVQDAYGNYVVQYVLAREEHETSSSQSNNQSIINQLVGSLNQLACQKFSSNVIEKCFDIGNDRLRARMIEQLYAPSTNQTINPSVHLPPLKTMRELIADPYANYVIQKALVLAKKPQVDNLIDCLRPHLSAVKHTAFGKRITAKIQKKFPNLDVMQWMEEGAAEQPNGVQVPSANQANGHATNQPTEQQTKTNQSNYTNHSNNHYHSNNQSHQNNHQNNHSGYQANNQSYHANGNGYPNKPYYNSNGNGYVKQAYHQSNNQTINQSISPSAKAPRIKENIVVESKA